MKIRFKIKSIIAAATFILNCSLAVPSITFAKQGATDAIPGTSKGATNSGGGGGKSGSTTVVTPSAPVQPLVTGTLTMTGSSYNGSTPSCTGSYHIDPYYPTLSLMTVDLSASGISSAEGSLLYVTVNGTGTLYPFLGGSMVVSGGSCTGSSQIYCTPGTVITSVTVTDLLGNIVFSGN